MGLLGQDSPKRHRAEGRNPRQFDTADDSRPPRRVLRQCDSPEFKNLFVSVWIVAMIRRWSKSRQRCETASTVGVSDRSNWQLQVSTNSMPRISVLIPTHGCLPAPARGLGDDASRFADGPGDVAQVPAPTVVPRKISALAHPLHFSSADRQSGRPRGAQKSYGTGRRSSSRRAMPCASGAT